jgi:ribosomal protein S18 acetylase RimI-like enzyme
VVETIRALRAADVRRLGNVLARAYESPHNFELPLEEYLRRAAATFVAEVDGVPVGIVVGNDYGTTAYVSMMGVDPAMQRRGIGSALMRALSAWAQQRRFDAIELDATPSGSPLYARFGFTPAGRTLVYVAGGAGGDARAARRYGAADRAAVLATDRHAFGADRGDVLRPLLEWAPNAVVVSGPRHAADGLSSLSRGRTCWARSSRRTPPARRR